MGKDRTGTEAKKRILVVGGGLAGSFFAAKALDAGHKVVLFDQPNPKSASRIAAGLFNVVTGRVAALTWQAGIFLDALKNFFQRQPWDQLSAHVHWMEVYRPFKQEDEKRHWGKMLDTENYDHILQIEDKPRTALQVNDPLGGMIILPCGWLDTVEFLTSIHRLIQLHENGEVYHEAFDYGALDPASGVLNGHGAFDQVVFAEGIGVGQNPWFHNLEILPLKGQVLEFTADHPLQGRVLLRKSFIIPKGEQTFTSGSTYEHHYADEEPDRAGEELLVNNAQDALLKPIMVSSMRAGIRPTTRTRRPLMGRHAQHTRLYVLNGLGTKGVIQAPWCAETLLAYMDGKIETLPKDLGPLRFYPDLAVI